MGVVDAHVLDPEAAGAVRRDVQREGAAVAELEAAVGPDDQDGDADAPQRLVQERRVVGAGDPAVLRGGDLQRPRQVGLLAVQLLVEPVPPAADGLGDGDAGGQRVGPRGQRDAPAATADPGADGAEGDGAPDAEPALPDLEGVHPVTAVAEVQLVVRDHVVQAAADESEGHRPHGDVGHGAGPATAGDPPPVAEPHGNEDADDDAERVAAQRNRAEIDHSARGAGDVGKFHGRVDATVPGGGDGRQPRNGSITGPGTDGPGDGADAPVPGPREPPDRRPATGSPSPPWP